MAQDCDGIPVLDLAPWLRGESGARDRLAGELRRACLEVGFFYVGGHGVEQLAAERKDTRFEVNRGGRGNRGRSRHVGVGFG